MTRLGTLLAMLTVLCAQVPWLGCVSDCQQSFVALLGTGAHDCHETTESPSACCSCHCSDLPEEEPEGGEHEVFSHQLLVHGDACALEGPAICCALPPSDADCVVRSPGDGRTETVRDPPPVPIEQAECTALLL